MLSGILAASLATARPAAAQLTCTVTVVASCTVGGAASAALSIQIRSVSRVTMASSSVSMPAPIDTSGFGPPGSVGFEVRSNAAWTLVISSGSAVWTASPPSARQNKPRSDLQWSLAAAGTYTDVTGTQVTFASGAATNSSVQTLYLRYKFAWLLDAPGNYSIPISVVLTAP